MRVLAFGLSFVVSAMGPSAALAQGTIVDSFSDIPAAVFHNIANGSPCGAHYLDEVQIDVGGGHLVTAGYYSELTSDHRYLIGCFNYTPSTWNNYRITPNPLVDPGDFEGDYETDNAFYGDVILNFSEPLTGFGSTSMLGPFATSSRPNNADTFLAYDGPNGTGNIIAEITTADLIHLKLFLDFKGVYFPTPRIRSVRYITVFPSITIDGFAIAVAPPACQPDLNGDGIVDNGDIVAFIALFLSGDLAADFNVDGLLDNGDIAAFITAFLGGC